MKTYQFFLSTQVTDYTTGDLRKFSSYVLHLTTASISEQDWTHIRVYTWPFLITHPEFDASFNLVVLIV